MTVSRERAKRSSYPVRIGLVADGKTRECKQKPPIASRNVAFVPFRTTETSLVRVTTLSGAVSDLAWQLRSPSKPLRTDHAPFPIPLTWRMPHRYCFPALASGQPGAFAPRISGW
ncbi:hypothetical protein MPL1032_180203 [Mesorhizobium plurifarium]|uniref:Uncharacterized protein n=1 Tax=Mesorhizobium plurifarium TaxID=69974 RepID=A0A0K2VTR8_MESPL|nr:hypothetical protein MPL1032_180203 [Mesorhizobium plurifarium]